MGCQRRMFVIVSSSSAGPGPAALSNPTGRLCLSIRVFIVYLSDCAEAAVHKTDKTQSNWSVYSSQCTN